MKMLLDADSVAFQVGASSQVPIQWSDGVWSMHADGYEAWKATIASIDEIRSAIGWDDVDDDIVIALSDPSRKYFRHDILPSYKSNRSTKLGPMLVGFIKDKLLEHYTSYIKPSLEGDDILGILATEPKLIKDSTVIVSIDKDLDTIPGDHFNPNKPEKGVYTISEEEADTNHLIQTLTGDSADGYMGCPGIGPVKAKRLLDKDLGWETVVNSYTKAGLTESDALTQARIARILRADNYDFSTKEIKLWCPTQ